jgi:hypothetical protein
MSARYKSVTEDDDSVAQACKTIKPFSIDESGHETDRLVPNSYRNRRSG